MNKVTLFRNIRTRQVYADASPVSSPIIPIIKGTARVHPCATIYGSVYVGEKVTVAPTVSICGYQGKQIWVGNNVMIQDGVILHSLSIYHDQEIAEEAVVEVEGNFYGVHIDDSVSLTSQCQVHGPVSIGANTFVGMQALIFRATVGRNCIIEPKALIMGVEVGDGRYVPAGALITTQAEANDLPYINRHSGFPRISSEEEEYVLLAKNHQQIELERETA